MSDTERCPNCNQVGWHHLSSEESGAEKDEYACDNDNCRVSYYEVAQ